MIITLSGGLNATTAPIDWERDDWGGHVTVAAYVDAEAGCEQ